jgi:hypothetical protein
LTSICSIWQLWNHFEHIILLPSWHSNLLFVQLISI